MTVYWSIVPVILTIWKNQWSIGRKGSRKLGLFWLLPVKCRFGCYTASEAKVSVCCGIINMPSNSINQDRMLEDFHCLAEKKSEKSNFFDFVTLILLQQHSHHMEHYLTGSAQITHFKSVSRRHTAFDTLEDELNNGTVYRMPQGGYHLEIPIPTTHSRVHLLNQLVLHHPDPDFDVARCLQEVRLTWQVDAGQIKPIPEGREDLQHFFDTPLTLVKVTGDQIELDARKDSPTFNGSTNFPLISRGDTGTTIRPFFFFSNSGYSLPLLALERMSLVLHVKSQSDNFSFSMWGFRLDAEEERRFRQLSHEYMIRDRSPIVSANLAKEVNSPTGNYWYPQSHRRWGAAFGASVRTLLLCLRRNYGSVGGFDRNLRLRLIREWAAAEGLPMRIFEMRLDFEHMAYTVTDFIFIPRDDEGRELPSDCVCILGAELQLNGLIPHGGSVSARRLLRSNRRWSFALTPDDLQPSGHMSLSYCNPNNSVLRVHCDSRVHQLDVMDLHYNVIRITQGMGGYAFRTKEDIEIFGVTPNGDMTTRIVEAEREAQGPPAGRGFLYGGDIVVRGDMNVRQIAIGRDALAMGRTMVGADDYTVSIGRGSGNV